MNGRLAGIPANVSKAQTLEVIFRGRSYIIVNEGQMEYQKMQAREIILCDLSVNKIDATEEVVDKMLSDWLANECPYATLEHVLGMMTDAEREQWKANYRFSGISRPKG